MLVEKKSFVKAIQFCMTIGPGWMLSMPSSEMDIECLQANIRRHTGFSKKTIWLGYHKPKGQIWTNVYGNHLQWSNYEDKRNQIGANTYGYTVLLRKSAQLYWRKVVYKVKDQRSFACQKCEYK